MGVVLVDVMTCLLSLLLSSCDDGCCGHCHDDVVVITTIISRRIFAWPLPGEKESAGRRRDEKREQEMWPGSGSEPEWVEGVD